MEAAFREGRGAGKKLGEGSEGCVFGWGGGGSLSSVLVLFVFCFFFFFFLLCGAMCFCLLFLFEGRAGPSCSWCLKGMLLFFVGRLIGCTVFKARVWHQQYWAKGTLRRTLPHRKKQYID